jgi:argininosuccinate lyase
LSVASPSRSGVFQVAADPRVERFLQSISFDRRLYAHDIAASTAHAQMLAKVGLISHEECQQIVQALAAIRQEIEQGIFQFSEALEDIHMHVEAALIERLGDVGRKLHTARSRNDQVATDLRLWTRHAIDQVDARLLALQSAFVGRCDADRDIVLPAYTHLRRAQPVLACHYWLAWCEKFHRDRTRLADARRRVNILPLGTGAVAGTSLAIDRQEVARRLGFDSVAANSLDATSDRDFIIETVMALSLVAAHLSGWAEEWILWSTIEFGFLELPQEFCTCSSMMPQKVNPDVLEVIRGKTARVIGAVAALLTLVKGLPLAYNRDLQEDKPPLFDAFDTVEASLELAAAIVAGAALKSEAIAARLDEGHLDSTTLMEYFIGRGLPQRTAHHAVGTLVRTAVERGVTLAQLPLAEYQAVCPAAEEGLYELLGAEGAVNAFASHGSTAPKQVDAQIQEWKERLARQGCPTSDRNR